MSTRNEAEMIRELVKIIKKHEEERPEFNAHGYSDHEWDVITDAIVRYSQR